MRTCVIQYAGGYYTTLLSQTFALHHSRCLQLRYSYLVSTIPWTDRHPVWEKCALILSAARKGYEHIIWLDSDTLWEGEPFPFPETMFGLTWHDQPTPGYPPHYNAGVMYINNTNGQAEEAIQLWWDTPNDNLPQWMDQTSLNNMLETFPDWVTKLDHRWNSVEHIPAYRSDNPAVRAWHGLEGGCLEQMKVAICNSIQKQL